MSQEILDKLDELKAGQDGIVERLERLEFKVGSIGQDFTEHMKGSNDNFESVLSSLKALHEKVSGDGNPPSRFVSSR